MPRRTLLLNPRALAFAIAMAAAPGMAFAHGNAASCPVGNLACPVVTDGFALCRKNDLLDFYVAGLPSEGNRDATPARLSGDQLSSPDSITFHLDGNTQLQRLDQLLRADALVWNADTTAYDASGHVRYQERGMLFSADRMQGTTDPEHGVADNVRYQLLSSRGNGVARQATMLDADHDTLTGVTYSTCDIHHRVWEIEAANMAMDRDAGIGRAHDVTMRLKGVPFLWLPYLRFPIDDRRQTGFLYPSFGNRSRAGFFVSLPFYWNIAPQVDATLTPTWFADRGPMLGGQLRWLAPGGGGQFDFDYLPDDRVIDRERNYVSLVNNMVLPGNLHWDTSIEHVSDNAWFQDFGLNATAARSMLLQSSSYLSSAGNWWYAGIGADSFQIVTPGIGESAEPYRRLPRLFLDAEHPIAGSGGPVWGVDAEAVRFVKPDALGGNRFDVFPYLAWPLQGAAWFLRPQLGLRYTSYDLSQPVAPGESTTPSRSTPIFDVDAGLVFERDVHLFGQDYTQTLEPRLYYLYVPYRNQDALPLFDTQPLSFDFWQLFTTNLFSGADRQMNANNLSAALTTRFLDANGVEKLSASFGQIRYFDTQKVTLYPGDSWVNRAGSDYVANLTVALNDNWRASASQQWNPSTHQTDVASVGLQRRFGEGGIVNFNYGYRRGLLEQAGLSAEIPLGAEWKLVGGYTYSLRDRRALDAFAGVEWSGCCTAVRLVTRHYVYDFQGDSNNAVMLEVEFKGIGSLGQHVGNFLQNAMLGDP